MTEGGSQEGHVWDVLGWVAVFLCSRGLDDLETILEVAGMVVLPCGVMVILSVFLDCSYSSRLPVGLLVVVLAVCSTSGLLWRLVSVGRSIWN